MKDAEPGAGQSKREHLFHFTLNIVGVGGMTLEGCSLAAIDEGFAGIVAGQNAEGHGAQCFEAVKAFRAAILINDAEAQEQAALAALVYTLAEPSGEAAWLRGEIAHRDCCHIVIQVEPDHSLRVGFVSDEVSAGLRPM
jgi:hypothetical protein